MPLKQRYQNPVVGDTIRLRMDIYNSNNYSDVAGFEKVEIYFLDPNNMTPENPDGRTLFAVYDGGQVVREAEGQYYVDLVTTTPNFVIGQYIDAWSIIFVEDEEAEVNENQFQIYPDLWITSPVPIIYDFAFRFTPSRIIKGSKKHIRIEIAPQVPQHQDLIRYYQNLAIVADVKVSMALSCGPCVPQEEDLRLVIDEEPVDFREKCYAYYKLDTTDMECGIYDVWFKLEFGDCVFISDRQQLQIHV